MLTRPMMRWASMVVSYLYRQGRDKADGEPNTMTAQRFKVGIVGLQPGRSWAARGHIPALRALPERFEIVGVANTSLESSHAAAAAMGLPKVYAKQVAEMVSAP